MNIVVAPNSFKGSLNAIEITDLIEEAFVSVNKDFRISKFPIADGGDFTLDIIIYYAGGTIEEVKSKDPFGRTVNARIGWIDQNIAIIELAETSGLRLLKEEEKDPFVASTFGTGELIKLAISKGAKKIILGIGGSATIDAGVGILKAFDVSFYDAGNNELTKVQEILSKLKKVDYSNLSNLVKDIDFTILCDVENPAIGINGAVKVFGRQKGAKENELDNLDSNIENYCKFLEKEFKCKLSDEKYMGASGGVPLSMKTFFNAKIIKGIDYISSLSNLDKYIKNSDLVITSEGRYDAQTLHGKAPFGIAEIAKKYNKPVILITGQTECFDNTIFDAIFPIVSKPDTLDNILMNSKDLLYYTAKQIAALITKTRKNEQA